MLVALYTTAANLPVTAQVVLKGDTLPLCQGDAGCPVHNSSQCTCHLLPRYSSQGGHLTTMPRWCWLPCTQQQLIHLSLTAQIEFSRGTPYHYAKVMLVALYKTAVNPPVTYCPGRRTFCPWPGSRSSSHRTVCGLQRSGWSAVLPGPAHVCHTLEPPGMYPLAPSPPAHTHTHTLVNS